MSVSKGYAILLLVTSPVQTRSFTILFALIVWWRLCSNTFILVRDLHIVHVHELSEWAFFSSVASLNGTYGRSLYRRSNQSSIIGFPSPTPSVHRLMLRNPSRTCDNHINNSVSVRILRNLGILGPGLLDVFGLLVNLLRGDGFRFSARSA